MKTPTTVFFFLLLLGSTALADTRYVDVSSTNPVPPFTNWATAATNIQDAVDAAVSGETVMIADGYYLLSSEVLVTNNVTVQSVNGPSSTVIDGQGITRCFNLDNHACILSRLTITNGYISGDGNYGGGIFCTGLNPVITNCTVIGNSAPSGGGICKGTANNCRIIENDADHGGGLYRTTANNCIISGNTAQHVGAGSDGGILNNCLISKNISYDLGGGVYWGTANNCTIIGNYAAYYGGGVFWGSASNCIIYYNRRYQSYGATLSYCCTPDVTPGVNGNIIDAPLLVDRGNGDYHLAIESPCINAGNNAYVVGATDLDGIPRIIDGTVDMGAYESFCVTDAYTAGSGFALEWMSLPAAWNSVIMYSTNLVTMPFTDLTAPMPYPLNSYTDTVHGAESRCFYRIEMVP